VNFERRLPVVMPKKMYFLV